MRLSFFAALGAISVLLVPSGLAQVKQGGHDFAGAKLTAPPTTSWPTNGGNLYNQRYSPLKAIDRTNVAQLKGVWRRACADPAAAAILGLRARRSSYDGVAYVSTGANDVFALSIDTGEILWQYERNVDPNITSVCCGWNNKGVALSEDKVFIGQLDGRLVALDRATGKVAWSIQAERWQENFSITAAPCTSTAMVIIGFAGGDRGTRSRVKAYDAKDGRLIWTFYTIPGPGEPGHDTWPKDNDAWKYGGAAIWQTPAVDLELGLLYFSTGNAAPDYNGAFRAGDNLYAASMLAIELATGKYRWHFQQVHHDIWDYDAVNPVILMDRATWAAARARRSPKWARPAGPTSSIARPGSRSSASTRSRCRRSRGRRPRRRSRSRAATPSCRSSSRLRRKGIALVNDGRIFTPFVGNDPTIVAPGIWGGASWPPSAYDPVQQRLFVCASSVINGFTGGGDPKFVTADRRASPTWRRDDVHARAADRHHRRARCDHQQAGVAISVARAVLQRHAGDRRRAAVRRPQRRTAHGARLGHRQAALGVPDRRRHARARRARSSTSGKQYVLAFSAGSALIGSARGDSVWLFGSRRDAAARSGRVRRCRAIPRRTPRQPAPAVARPQRLASLTRTRRGQALFEQACVVCHGDDGKGGHGGGAPLDQSRGSRRHDSNRDRRAQQHAAVQQLVHAGADPRRERVCGSVSCRPASAMIRLVIGANMTRVALAAVLVLSIAVSACQTPAADVQQDESAVREVFERYLKSVNAADLPLASEVWLQSADVVAVTPFGRFQGWDQVRDEVYIKFLQQSLTERDLQPSNVSIHTMGDSAWLAFDWAFKGTMATGQPIESKGWESHVYQRTDRGWKIVHLHYSSPASSATSVTVSHEVAWSAVALVIAMGVGRSRRSRPCPTHHHRRR